MTDFEKSILEASLVQLAVEKTTRKMLEKIARKMELCHLYGSNCGMCMVAAPYSYCCRAECGTKDYCEGCNYKGENQWAKNT